MHADRLFSAIPARREIARTLYARVEHAPIVSPHGHVDPRLFVQQEYDWGTPVDVFIIPDHYVFRMLYSQGVPLSSLGIPRRDGARAEADHRKIWQTFANHFHLFHGTPTSIWLRDAFERVFGVTAKLTSSSAMAVYDALEAKLQEPDVSPRRLYKRFNIDALCTTDGATSTLHHHRQIRASGWDGDIRPTFRPDDVVKAGRPGWRDNLDALSDLTSVDVVDYDSYLRAIEARRETFRELGATATDHDVWQLPAERADRRWMQKTFAELRRGEHTDHAGAARFAAQMLYELARMSAEDGLVMQLHVGAFRNHNQQLYETYGPDMGADIPHGDIDFTGGLHGLLNQYGTHPNFRLVVFTLDEDTYSRELAPLAGHYPALRLGPPWWFHDSPNGIRRYLDRVTETAGIYNTAGFNDDTRAFPSIPARHDMWRRVSADWLAGRVVRHLIDEEDAHEMIHALAHGLARRTYRLTEETHA